MAEEEVTRDIEAALNTIVNTTEQSGNMRKELKKIYETVSILRTLFMTLKVQLEGKSENEGLESEVRDAKTIYKDRYIIVEERRQVTSSDRGGNLQQQ